MGSVDRCVCHQTLFSDMLTTALAMRARGVDDDQHILQKLRDQTGCTTGCALCTPYILRMIQTGQTTFDPLPL